MKRLRLHAWQSGAAADSIAAMAPRQPATASANLRAPPRRWTRLGVELPPCGGPRRRARGARRRDRRRSRRQLIERAPRTMRAAGALGAPDRAASSCARRLGEDHLRQRLMVFGRVQEALARLRDVRSTDAMIRRAPAEVALGLRHGPRRDLPHRGQDDARRGVLHRRRRGARGAACWRSAASTRPRSRPDAGARDAAPPPADGRARRAEPPVSYKPFVTRYDTHAYVAAPIMPEGRVIGFLHADKGLRHPRTRAASTSSTVTRCGPSPRASATRSSGCSCWSACALRATRSAR